MTWIEKLRKKLPNSIYAVYKDMLPTQCPYMLFGDKAPGKGNMCGEDMRGISCWQCWYREVEGGDDQRGRI